MPTLEELADWDVGELHNHILSVLPEGVVFKLEPPSPYFRGIYTNQDGDILWADVNPDLRILLLDAYGWLWKKTAKVSPNSVWTPRQREVMPRPSVGPRTLPGVSIPDPEDLDPAEITALYENRDKK